MYPKIALLRVSTKRKHLRLLSNLPVDHSSQMSQISICLSACHAAAVHNNGLTDRNPV